MTSLGEDSLGSVPIPDIAALQSHLLQVCFCSAALNTLALITSTNARIPAGWQTFRRRAGATATSEQHRTCRVASAADIVTTLRRYSLSCRRCLSTA